LQYPAIAECDETHRKKGEGFSGAQTARFFVTAIEWHAQASWEALYQQHPIVTGGGVRSRKGSTLSFSIGSS